MIGNTKIALFIDGANLYATTRALGFEIDYRRLLREFQSRGYLIRACYYTLMMEDNEFSSIRPLIDWLDYNGYHVVRKSAREFIDAQGRRRVKGDISIDFTIDALEMADHVDEIVLFTGDGDYAPLVDALKRKGVRVLVASTLTSQGSMVADELRRRCDQFLELAHMANRIGRDPKEIPNRDEPPSPGVVPSGEEPRASRPERRAPGGGLERRYGLRTGTDDLDEEPSPEV
jgi:uncharacterized LabA/DUF88 family protein